MKYSLIFAATAAASEVYGGYGAQQPSSSVPAKVSSVPVYGGYVPQQSSSAPAYGGYNGNTPSAKTTPPAKATPCSTTVGKNGYTTVVPGYGKPPVTVTQQHQAYPTCVAKGYGDQCDKWEEDKYVSTTITDYNKNVVTVTKVQDYVTVYQEKKTVTKCATSAAGGYKAVPTGTYNKNATTWYELYEKIHVVQYKDMGKNALTGYSGSGLCQACDNTQPIVVKEYKDGKWTESKKDIIYGKPKDEVKVYEKPGVYTVPAKVVTVDYPVTYIDSATKTAKAGETCTYGGQYKEVKSTGTITGVYGAKQTTVVNGKTETCTVTKTVTVFCAKVGKCEIQPATTTVYDKDTKIVYPTAGVYEAGVYHYEAKTITITQPNQAYTCKYEATPVPASKTPSVPAYKTPTNDYGYKASATPTPNQPYGGDHPSYPIKSNSTSSAYNNGYGSKPSTTPCTTLIKASSTPVVPSVYKPVYGSDNKPSTTPCSTLIKASATPAVYQPVYGDNSKPSSSPAVAYPPTVTPAYNNGGYGDNSKPSTTVPSKASSTPCDEDKKPSPTPVYPNGGNNGGYGGNAQSTPAYNNGGYGGNSQPTPTPVNPSYPAQSAAYGGNNNGQYQPSYAKRAGMVERRNALVQAL
jgi:hypothetical protein